MKCELNMLCKCGCGEELSLDKQLKRIRNKKGEKSDWYIYGHHIRSADTLAILAWKGKARISSGGYKMMSLPGHPRANKGGNIREHIVIAENALGGPLPPGVQVHHVNEKSDNTSLVICENQEYHHLLHMRERALRECGDANKRKCSICKQYDNVGNLFCKKLPSGGWSVYHRSCKNKRKRDKNSLARQTSTTMGE